MTSLLGIAALVAAVLGAISGSGASAAPAGAAKFVPVTPFRVLDTRSGGGPVAPDGSIDGQITGQGPVPGAGVSAVVLNVTVNAATRPGFTQVYPTGRTALAKQTSNLNVEYAGQTIPNAVVVPVGDGGKVTVYTQGGGQVIADVFGYFTTASTSRDGRYVDVTPTRLLDTRQPDGGGRLSAGSDRSVQVTGRAGVPGGGVSAVVLNVTAVEADPGYWQVIPATSNPAIGSSSNLNVERANQTIPNLVVVPVGPTGGVLVHSESGGHLLVDVLGYFTDGTAADSEYGLFVPLDPVRALDTRASVIPGANSTTPVQLTGRLGLPADGVRAVFGNFTATQSGGIGWAQALPNGAGSPGAWSNLNIDRVGQTIPNAIVANVGTGGVVNLYTVVPTHLLLDVAGYFTAPVGPPSIAITAPAAGNVRGTVNVTTAVTGLNIQDVQFFLDNDPTPLATDTTAPYGFAWRSGLADNGAHTLRATVRNSTGSATASVGVTLANGFISLTFDDGWAEHATTVRTALESRQMRGTFYLNSVPIRDGYAAYMTPADVTALDAAGHEIGAHTAYHYSLTQKDNWTNAAGLDCRATPSDVRCTVATEAQITTALTDTNAYLKTLTGKDPKAFATPYGEYTGNPNLGADAAAQKTKMLQLFSAAGYTSHRTVDNTYQYNNPEQPMELSVWNIHGTDPQGGSWVPQTLPLIQQVAQNGGWLILVFHHVDNLPHTFDDYDATPAELAQYLDAIVSSGVRVLPVTQAMADHPNNVG